MVRQSLRLRPELAQISILNDWLDAGARRAGLDIGVAGDIKLCLNEAVANIISYGAPGVGSPEIAVDLELSADRALAVVADNCPAFDPLAYPEPAKIHGLDNARIGGFGISIMRSTATALGYARVEGGNRLSIECRARD